MVTPAETAPGPHRPGDRAVLQPLRGGVPAAVPPPPQGVAEAGGEDGGDGAGGAGHHRPQTRLLHGQLHSVLNSIVLVITLHSLVVDLIIFHQWLLFRYHCHQI